MIVEENKVLAPLTTFGIGGAAQWFVEAQSEEDLLEAQEFAAQRHAPLFVLGGGSNVLIADRGFEGLVLHIALQGIELRQRTSAEITLSAMAGEPWDDCVRLATESACAGIECLAGIPGTVGGTPVQNVGAYGQEVATVIERVRAFDLQQHAFVELSSAECGFAYRRSRFNTADRGRYVVTRVDYKLQEGGPPTLEYADLKMRFADRSTAPSLNETADAVREIRRSKGMLLVNGDPDCRSAGSFFKNPLVTEGVAAQLREFAAGHALPLRLFPAEGELVKIPAAWLIEQAGFPRGFALGHAGISSRHTLALVNRGGATAAEIKALAEVIRHRVSARFGIQLESETELVGF